MDKKQFLDLLERQQRGVTSAEEDSQLDEVFDKIQHRAITWEMNRFEEEAIKSRIKRHIDSRLDKSEKNRMFWIFSYWRYVASILFILGLVSLLYFTPEKVEPNPLAEKRTGERQKATIKLQDGTMVYLNVNSKIRFPERFEVNSRTVELEGEAFFEVIHDKKRPFVVTSRGVNTEVLGTSFNVKATEGNDVEVLVKSGKVAVGMGEKKQDAQLVLNPSQLGKVDASNKEISVIEVDVDDYLTWRSETIAFDLVPFNEVISRLEKVYNIDIEIEGSSSSDCLIKARYSNRSLFTVLYGLKNIVDFDYEKKQDGAMLIKYRGCRK